ncbi:MAG TPA: FhaA domain-containing protein [Capsulimonadaceae bacterium]|nr:FhaA domain-containing protein [Capsulimonadaceae bacterium]
MDVLERFNTKFGKWYEGLFGETGREELRPKDVLRKILNAMEEHRSEGFDGKTYVPNKFVLELNVPDQDQRDYLLSFLDEEELAAVLQRYMAQNGYSIRGPLDFTIKDKENPEEGAEKLTVRVRYEKGAQPEAPPPAPEPPREEIEDLPTVAAVGLEEDATVAGSPTAWAALAITNSEGRRSLVTITKPVFTIGRSRHGGNDLVLDTDGQASKRHVRIERETDGHATLFDLASTNGTFVNGKLVNGNITISDGDEIVIGQSRLLFQQDAERGESPAAPAIGTTKRARLLREDDGKEYVLASETLIGRAVTSDIVLDSAEVATRQAQVIAPDAQTYLLEDLAGRGTTFIQGRQLGLGERVRLNDGDEVVLGGSRFRFALAEGNG